jgi:tetratricopeptide (TPR) repeat protein
MKTGRRAKRNAKSPAGEGVTALLLRADVLLARNDTCGAIDCANRVLAADGTHVGALETLAKALWQACRLEDLLLTLRRLIELNPYEPGYHALQAAAFQSMGRAGEALKAYSRATELGDVRQDELRETIEELQQWQGSLVAQLIKEDAVFRAEYDQDPAEACRKRGFAFVAAERALGGWYRESDAQGGAFARPS